MRVTEVARRRLTEHGSVVVLRVERTADGGAEVIVRVRLGGAVRTVRIGPEEVET